MVLVWRNMTIQAKATRTLTHKQAIEEQKGITQQGLQIEEQKDDSKKEI